MVNSNVYTLPEEGSATQRSWSVSGSEAKAKDMAQQKMTKIAKVLFVGDMFWMIIIYQLQD